MGYEMHYRDWWGVDEGYGIHKEDGHGASSVGVVKFWLRTKHYLVNYERGLRRVINQYTFIKSSLRICYDCLPKAIRLEIADLSPHMSVK